MNSKMIGYIIVAAALYFYFRNRTEVAQAANQAALDVIDVSKEANAAVYNFDNSSMMGLA